MEWCVREARAGPQGPAMREGRNASREASDARVVESDTRKGDRNGTATADPRARARGAEVAAGRAQSGAGWHRDSTGRSRTIGGERPRTPVTHRAREARSRGPPSETSGATFPRGRTPSRTATRWDRVARRALEHDARDPAGTHEKRPVARRRQGRGARVERRRFPAVRDETARIRCGGPTRKGPASFPPFHTVDRVTGRRPSQSSEGSQSRSFPCPTRTVRPSEWR